MPHSPLSEPFIYSIIGLVFGIYIFIKSFGWRGRKNLIENTPTSKIRSLAMGLVEVYGQIGLAKGELLKTPFSGANCVYYRYDIQRWQQSKHGGHWVSVKKGSAGTPFFLKDETGAVLVDPAGAEVEIPLDRAFESGRGKDLPQIAIDFMEANGVHHENFLGMDRKMRVEEYCISPGDTLYVMGTAGDNPFAEAAAEHTADIMIQKGRNEKIFYISDKPEKEILKRLKWKVWGGAFGGIAVIAICLFLMMGMLHAL